MPCSSRVLSPCLRRQLCRRPFLILANFIATLVTAIALGLIVWHARVNTGGFRSGWGGCAVGCCTSPQHDGPETDLPACLPSSEDAVHQVPPPTSLPFFFFFSPSHQDCLCHILLEDRCCLHCSRLPPLRSMSCSVMLLCFCFTQGPTS